MTTETYSPPTVTVRRTTLVHTPERWKSLRNRHPTTGGRSWGWLEGPQGHICWSNDPGSDLTEQEAGELVRLHDEWLSAQEPLEVKRVKAWQKLEALEKRRNETQAAFNAAAEAFAAQHRILDELLAPPARLEGERPHE